MNKLVSSGPIEQTLSEHLTLSPSLVWSKSHASRLAFGWIGFCQAKLTGKKFGYARGEFAPPQDIVSANLVQGDMAVPEGSTGGDTLDAFVRDEKALWNTGVVPYRFEVDEYQGNVEPVFTDAQMRKINESLQHIEAEVPYLEFRYSGLESISLYSEILVRLSETRILERWVQNIHTHI